MRVAVLGGRIAPLRKYWEALFVLMDELGVDEYVSVGTGWSIDKKMRRWAEDNDKKVVTYSIAPKSAIDRYHKKVRQIDVIVRRSDVVVLYPAERFTDVVRKAAERYGRRVYEWSSIEEKFVCRER